MKTFFSKTLTYLVYLISFLIPVYFLTITQEFFNVNKFYLIGFVTILSLVLLTINFIIHKKISWKKSIFDNSIFLFLFFYATSVVLVSPNKIQALTVLPNGFFVFLFLAILFFVINNNLKLHQKENIFKGLNYSALVLALLNIVMFFEPFKNVKLPDSLSFLKVQTFSPIGTQVDLAIFLGFFAIFNLFKFLNKKEEEGEKVFSKEIVMLGSLFLIIISLSLSLYLVFKPIKIADNQTTSIYQSLPPFSITWYSAIETLKNPMSLFLGFGPDNFAAVYTKVKPVEYNTTAIWNLNFAQGSNFLLQLWTEGGLLSLLSFGILLFVLIKKTASRKHEKYLLYSSIYLVLALFVAPTSITILTLLFLLLTQVEDDGDLGDLSFDTGKILPVYFGVIILAILFIAPLTYFIFKNYEAEVFFKKSQDGFAKNDAKQIYDNQKLAIENNPYIEKFRTNFAQTNLLIANRIASKKKEDITDEDRQNITYAIQDAIGHAKEIVKLNPAKSNNWESLAYVYRNILNVAQGADSWTIAAYQRAIVADPNNPTLRLNLGGVYYSLGNFDEAIKFFQQAIELKPDWANAHYNLSHAYIEKKEYLKAAQELQGVMTLVNPKSDDYKKTQAELEEVKKLLPKEEVKTGADAVNPKELSLPTPPVATISPKLQLENKEVAP